MKRWGDLPDFTDHRPGAGPGDFDREDLAAQVLVAFDEDQLIGGGAAFPALFTFSSNSTWGFTPR